MVPMKNVTTQQEKIMDKHTSANSSEELVADLLAALRNLLRVADEELDPKRTPEMHAARVAIARATST
jgi:hypothetical protein